MSHPSLTVSRTGDVTNVDGAARDLLGKTPGLYRALRAGSLVVLALDEGTGAAPKDGESLALAGDLESMSLLGLLNILGQGRETGRLVVKRDQIERVIMIRDGDVASVGSNAPQDRLGRFLVRLGKVSEADLDDAIREAQGTGRRIGQVLLGRGHLDAHELWATIQAQITEIFADVVAWEDGSFVLFRLPEDFRFPSTPPMSMQGLLLEAVRRADEMSVYREDIPHRNVIFERVPNASIPPGIDELAVRVLEALSGRLSVVMLAEKLHLSEFEVTSGLHQLLQRRLIQIVASQGPAPEDVVMGPEEAAKLEVYNLAFREIRDEIVRNGKLEPFLVGVHKYLRDPTGPHAPIFERIEPDLSGALPAQQLVANASQLRLPDAFAAIGEALNDLTFFMLFQCGELLDPQSDENLARRVRLIHAALRSGR
jgi:hypothetical protein